MQEKASERLPKFTKEEVEKVKGSIDCAGINQYTTKYAFNRQENSQSLGFQQDWSAGFAVSKRGVPIGPKANSYWLYDVPWGFCKALMYIKERCGNPTVIITENGMDDPGNVTLTQGLHDTRRIDFCRSYLKQLKKAIDDGANVVGYFA